ncbi:MAG: hypothetical protein RSP_03520 [Rhodanobacter sp.]
MKRWLIGFSCLWLSGVALAAAADDAHKFTQASMLVSGSIEVAPDGSVMQYALDHPDELPAQVKDLLAKAIPTWKFKPVAVDGKPAIAKASMSVRVLAMPMANDMFRLDVAAAHFFERNGKPAIKAVQERNPVYPSEALRERVTGTVYLVARLDAAGKVVDAAAQQVDLGKFGSAVEMERWRDQLARVSVRAAQSWLFSPATDGATAYRVIRLPVTFAMRINGYSTRAHYGQWDVYIPGPMQWIPWLDKRQITGGVDAVPDGAIDQVGRGLRLLTPLKGA